MKRLITSSATVMLLAFGAAAATLTPEQALQRLAKGQHRIAAKDAPALVHTSLTRSGSPAVYVFNRADNKGYMLLSADSEAYPVLGYSDKGSFAADDMPPAMQWWLDEYARQIEYASATSAPCTGNSEAALKASREGRTAIEPMIKTHWDQSEPYNRQCPSYGGVRTYTGCVATAAAQVMKYFEYPPIGKGQISYTASTIGKRISLDFTKEAFEWSKMLDSYIPGQYTDEEADAVAYLMKAAGYAVKMDYGTTSSGALAMNIRRGLVNYFDYDGNARYTMRIYHSPVEWEELIYNNLKTVGPVIYGGSSTIGGGHSFVCDGYDGEGFFHFNWGWTGMSDGFFSLNALNPDALGSGGGSGGGYNFTQDAVLGLQPPTGEPLVEEPDLLTQQGALEASVSNGVISFTLSGTGNPLWANYNPVTMSVSFGACFESVSDAEAEPVYAKASNTSLTLNAGYGAYPAALKPSVKLSTLNLADGTYKVYMVTIDTTDDNATWQPMKGIYGKPLDVTLVKNGEEYTVINGTIPALVVTAAEFTADIYYGCATSVKITVENPTDMDLESGFAPIFFSSGTAQWLGESVMLSVPAHQSVTREWTTDLYNLVTFYGFPSDVTYQFSFYDEGSGAYYSDSFLQNVVMHPAPAAPALSLPFSISVKNAADVEKSGTTTIYHISNPSDIEVSTYVQVTSGYFAYPFVTSLCLPADNDGYSIETYASSTQIIKEKTGKDVVAHLSYPQMQKGTDYHIVVGYDYGGTLTPINNGKKVVVVRLAESGVEDVAVDNELAIDCRQGIVCCAGADEIEAYTLTGIRIASVQGQQLDLTGHSGMAVIVARSKTGSVTTAKIAL